MKHNLFLLFAFCLALLFTFDSCKDSDTGTPPVVSAYTEENLFDKPFIGTVDLLPSEKKPTGIVSIRETNPDLESSYVRSFMFDGLKYLSGTQKLSLGDTVFFKIKKTNGILLADSLFKWKSQEAIDVYKKGEEISTMTISKKLRDTILANYGCIDLARQYKHHLDEVENFHTRVHFGAPTQLTTVKNGVNYTAYNLFFNDSPIPENPFYIANSDYSEFKNNNNGEVIYYIAFSVYDSKKFIDELSTTHNHSGH